MTAQQPSLSFKVAVGNTTLAFGTYSASFFDHGRAVLSVEMQRIDEVPSKVATDASQQPHVADTPSLKVENSEKPAELKVASEEKPARQQGAPGLASKMDKILTAVAAAVAPAAAAAAVPQVPSVEAQPKLATCHTGQIVAILGAQVTYSNCITLGPSKWFELCTYREPSRPDSVWTGVKNGDRIVYSTLLTRAQPYVRILISFVDDSCDPAIPANYSMLGAATLQVDPAAASGFNVKIAKGMIINDKKHNNVLDEFVLSVK